MARKTSTVLLMMTGTLLALVLVVGAGMVLMTEYEATVYEYEVTAGSVHEYLAPEGSKVTANLSGSVNTTHMTIFGFERITTVSNITYPHDGGTKQYDISGKWNLFTELKIGEHDYDIDDYETFNHGIVPVSVYVIEEGNELITRYIGQDDGIVYRLDRLIVVETDGQILMTRIIQQLNSYEETMMPIKL